MKVVVLDERSRALRTAIEVDRGQCDLRAVRRRFWATPGCALLLAAFLIAFRSTGAAQQVSSAAGPAEEEPLAEQVNDPLAHLTQVQIKDIYTPSEYGTNAQPNTIQFRPILAIRPFSLMPLEQLVRPTLKVATVATGKGSSTTSGFDDMQLLDLFVLPWPNSTETHFRWGIGPYLVFPTVNFGNRLFAKSDEVGKAAWQAGPAAGFSYRGITGLNISALLQQATSFAYASSRSHQVRSLTFQPILSYQLRNGWYLKSSDATWTFNLLRHTSTTIPLSAGFGRVWQLSSGYAIDTSISGEWTAYRQFSDQTEQFSLNFQVGLVLPKLDL